MSERRIGPFIIDEPEFRYNNLLNDEGMNQLNNDDSNNTSSFMSHDRGSKEFSIWNNDPPEPLQQHSNGFHSNRQQNSFFGTDDSSKGFTGGFFGSKDTHDLPSPIGTIPTSAAKTNQFNMASQSFPVFTPRQQYIHTPSYNHQHHHHPQQQQMPLSFPPSSSSSEQQKPSPAPKLMTAAEFHLTRFGSFRLSVSPPDSLMVNNEEEDDQKTPTD
uniref:Uncharacterized protein n=1 Tax=Panagrolaimus sp. PS1159 TaxID=55785 RepID=A0AC35GL91_9BILA